MQKSSKFGIDICTHIGYYTYIFKMNKKYINIHRITFLNIK